MYPNIPLLKKALEKSENFTVFSFLAGKNNFMCCQFTVTIFSIYYVKDIVKVYNIKRV